MTERRQQFARVAAGLLAAAIIGMWTAGAAHAQVAFRDQSGTLTATPEQDQTKTALYQRFAGSFADFSTYMGSGTFYSSGYHDPYVSNALFLRPMFNLGTKFKLSLNARLYLEEEYTKPDNSTGRHFNPSDSWLFLQAKNLYTMPRAKITFGGTFRAVVPTSWESQYSHLVTGVGVGLSARRLWEFGTPDAKGKRWELVASLGSTFTKFFRTSPLRGNSPGDSSGCRTAAPEGAAAAGPSETDHCGGPLSTSYAVTTAGNVALARGRYSVSVSMSVINEFRYSVDPSVFNNALALDSSFTVPMGRSDLTWGIISFGYDLTDHVGFSLGIASFQPALDSRYQHLRNPFFDFSGPNANNFTQAFVGVTGTL
ncbi:MAG TPA: hypothetical protein VHJ20_11490 [Polyangia bacterium]|nr:hypothetical protein [Polyangia bacterium]